MAVSTSAITLVAPVWRLGLRSQLRRSSSPYFSFNSEFSGNFYRCSASANRKLSILGKPISPRKWGLFAQEQELTSAQTRQSNQLLSTLSLSLIASQLLPSEVLAAPTMEETNISTHFLNNLLLMDLDPSSAKLAISIIGPFLSAYGFLFIARIVMSWYPKLPVGKFPYVLAYAPTEPVLVLTRKVIPPLGGVDVTPVVWFGLISFLNEILVGPQGLLVLLSQQV
ncbi:cofactor assembly, complex C (B6F) [Wolffia australiana]